jgi:glutamate--cysteine ligase
MLADIQKKYDEYGIDKEPRVFIKNNAGTYGLAVTQVNSGQEVKEWNNKARKKMKAAKGGAKVTEIILQEGIPSIVKSDDGATAEPVIYMFGCQLIGGFFRTHSKKSENESLNSPGAVFKRMCMTDLRMEPDQHMEENVYGWLAKLSSLAVALEAQDMGVSFLNYRL